MDANIRQQDVFHRRGLLLGLTMAEIMILILFCLLLLFGVQKIFFEKEIEKRDATINSAIRDGKMDFALIEAIPKLVAEKPADTKYSDWFSELVRSGQERDKEKARREELSKELVQARSDLETVQRRKKGLEQELAKAKTELARANEKLANAKIPSDETLEDAKSFKEIAARFSKDTPRQDIVSWVKKARENEQKLAACERQTAAMRRKCLGSGKPSCWYDDAGFEDLIFDVALTSSGLVVVDRKLPYRAVQQASLPIGGMVFGKETTDDNFLFQTKPIFEWSESHDCRFYVRVFDFTKPNEKEVYKRRVRILEERFYSRKKEREKNHQFSLQEEDWKGAAPEGRAGKRGEMSITPEKGKAIESVSPDKAIAPSRRVRTFEPTPPAGGRSDTPNKVATPQKKTDDVKPPSDQGAPPTQPKDSGNPFQLILDFLKSGTSQ